MTEPVQEVSTAEAEAAAVKAAAAIVAAGDASAETSASASTSSGTSATATSSGEPWPPPNWSKQKAPRKAMLHITNLLEHRVSRLKTPESTAVNPAESEITTLFASSREYVKNFNWKEVRAEDYACHAVPDCPFPKTVFIHLETLRAISVFRQRYTTCGIEFHRAPHPRMRGVWWITDIYVFAGNAILGEMRSARPCAYCERNTAWLTCYCETVEFCSRACQDRAIVDGKHTPKDCCEAHARHVTQSAVRAKTRMIELKKAIEQDEQFARQISVEQQQKIADLEEDAKRTQQNAADYLRARKARLMAESARSRQASGMEPDPNIPAELQVGGAQHEEALKGPTGGPLPPDIPPPKHDTRLDP